MLVWLPAPLVAAGLDSLANEVMGLGGVPSSWGAISPGPVGGVALLARWSVEYVAVGGFAIAASLYPAKVLGPLVATERGPLQGIPDTDLPFASADRSGAARTGDPSDGPSVTVSIRAEP